MEQTLYRNYQKITLQESPGRIPGTSKENTVKRLQYIAMHRLIFRIINLHTEISQLAEYLVAKIVYYWQTYVTNANQAMKLK